MLGLCGLNGHRKKYHFITESTCPACGNPRENEEHFFIHCVASAAHREVLKTELGQLLLAKANMLTQLEIKCTRKVIIKGTKFIESDTTFYPNCQIHKKQSVFCKKITILLSLSFVFHVISKMDAKCNKSHTNMVIVR